MPSSSSQSAVPLTRDGAVVRGFDRYPTEIEYAYQARAERLGRGRYLDYPLQVGIETLSVCNAACGFCPYPGMERKGQRMSDTLLDSLLGQIADLPHDLPVEVNFSRVNEPFLDTRVHAAAARVLREHPLAELWLFTNGSALTDRTIGRLESLGRVPIFIVSFNDHRREQYERVMRIPYERTVRNLDRLHESLSTGRLRFTPTISRVSDDPADDEDFLRWVAGRWPGFGCRVTPRFDWIGEAATSRRSIPPVACVQWFHLPVLASGLVAHCCIDHEGAHGIGDTNERTLLEIYNHPERRGLRADLARRLGVPVCGSCNHLG